MKAVLKRIGWALLGIGGLVVAMVGVGLLAFVLPDALASGSWPTTQGQITRSNVEDAGDPEEAWPDIAFRYKVGVRAYVSEALSVGYLHGVPTTYPFSFIADWKVNQYPVGAAVTVYYRPEDPSDAVLEPGLIGAFWNWMWGCVFILLGLLFSFGSFSTALGRDLPAILKPNSGNGKG